MSDNAHILPLLTIPQAMNLTALSRATLYRLVQDGQLDTVRIGRTVRVTRGSIEALVARSTVPANNAS